MMVMVCLIAMVLALQMLQRQTLTFVAMVSIPDMQSDGDGVRDCNDDCPADPTKTAWHLWLC